MKRVLTLTLLMIFSFSFAQRTERSQEKILYRDHLANDLKIKMAAKHKSFFDYTQKLDSVVDVPYQLYDSRTKEVFHYNSNGFNDLMIKFLWSTNLNQYSENSKYEYVHDIKGNITEEIFYELVDPDGMIPHRKYKRTYNQNDQLLTEVKSTFQYFGNKEWLNEYRKEYTYDNQGNLLEDLHFEWDQNTNQWLKIFKTEYTYNTEGYDIKHIAYNWDQTAQLWNKNKKYEYKYTSNGSVEEFVLYIWDKSAMSWENQQKIEYSYTANGDISKMETNFWDKSADQWDLRSESLYTYNTEGNLTEVRTNGSLFGSGTWGLVNRYVYEYDNIDISEVILPYFYDCIYGFAKHMLVREKYYFGQTLTNDKSLYYSGISSLAVDEHNRKKFTIFPNPVGEMLHIKTDAPLKQVEVFSILGERVKKVKYPEKAIDMEDISRGIYLIRIRSEEGVAVIKMIKL